MHKIKEMLHKDSEDKDIKRDESHSHNHNHNHGEVLREENFQHGHTHHGEIEHGRTTTTTTREVIHDHGANHSHEHQHLHGEKIHGDKHLHGGEKHTYYERETLQGGDLYRSGADPTLNREVITETRHDGGVSREVVGEAKIVKEKIKEVELHKVQPVIHRDREQKEIRHVVEPHQKFEVKDTHIAHKEKDIDLGTRREASTLETSRSIGGAPQIESSREFLGTERQHQELPARLEEHVHRKVEEHVHPVVYKETLKPKVTEEVHHVYETVKEKPIETYEVKEVHMRGDGLNTAERAFFEQQTSRGIDIDNSRSLNMHTKCAGCNNNFDRSIETTTIRSTGGHEHNHGNMESGFSGHHQNIGAHHLPASAVEGGHNSAYDAALCNQCSGHQICSHSAKDATLMQKMNEKKIVQDEKLHDKMAKKASKDKSHKSKPAVV